MSKKLKIGFFTDTYFPQTNGVVISNYHFKTELEKMGHQVYIITAHVPGYRDQDPSIIRFRSAQAFFHPELRFPVFFGPRGLKKIFNLKLDIIHSHSPLSMGWLAEFMAFTAHTPHIHTYHTIYPEYIHYLSKNKLITKIATKYLTEKAVFVFLNRCDHIIAPSQKIYDYLTPYIHRPIHLQPSGIPTRQTASHTEIKKIRKKYNINPDDKVIIWVGRMGQEKNLDLFYQIIKDLILRNRKIKCLMIGDGPLRAELTPKAKEDNLGNNLIFTGYIKNEIIHRYYQASDLLLFTSQSETQGITILEALSAGLPAITIKDSAYATSVISNLSGYQIDSNQPGPFIQKILDLFDNQKLYDQLSAGARQHAINFDIRTCAQQLLDYYQTLL